MQAQQQLEASRAAQAYYQKALQELTLFKSKTSAALLQVPPSPPPHAQFPVRWDLQTPACSYPIYAVIRIKSPVMIDT